MKIKQIISFPIGKMIFIYGLGKDNKMYFWKSDIAQWVLNKVDPQPSALKQQFMNKAKSNGKS